MGSCVCVQPRRCRLSGRTGTGPVCAVRDAVRLCLPAATQRWDTGQVFYCAILFCCFQLIQTMELLSCCYSTMDSRTATSRATLCCLDPKVRSERRVGWSNYLDRPLVACNFCKTPYIFKNSCFCVSVCTWHDDITVYFIVFSLSLSPSLSGVNTGGVGSYIYDEPEAEAQPWALTQHHFQDVSLICLQVSWWQMTCTVLTGVDI